MNIGSSFLFILSWFYYLPCGFIYCFNIYFYLPCGFTYYFYISLSIYLMVWEHDISECSLRVQSFDPWCWWSTLLKFKALTPGVDGQPAGHSFITPLLEPRRYSNRGPQRGQKLSYLLYLLYYHLIVIRKARTNF